MDRTNALLATMASVAIFSGCAPVQPARLAAISGPQRVTPAAFYAVQHCVEQAVTGHGFRLRDEDPLTGGRNALTATTTRTIVVGDIFDRIDVALHYSASGDSAWAVAAGANGRWASDDGGWESISGVTLSARQAADAVNASCGRASPVVVHAG